MPVRPGNAAGDLNTSVTGSGVPKRGLRERSAVGPVKSFFQTGPAGSRTRETGPLVGEITIQPFGGPDDWNCVGNEARLPTPWASAIGEAIIESCKSHVIALRMPTYVV